jgi:CopG family transcriptional regulator, nickel-responsive regulator
MQRITITIDDDLLAEIDALVVKRGYGGRSEAIRDLARGTLAQQRLEEPGGACVGTLSYVYDHHVRDLPNRLIGAHHERHDLAIAGMHVHLDHDNCLEVSVLRGPYEAVRAFADAISTQRGVEHAQLHVVPAQITTTKHSHGRGGGRSRGAATHEHVEV